MVDEYDSSVNGTKQNIKQNEEVMIPYPLVLLISWDRQSAERLQKLRNGKGLSQLELAKLTKGVVSRRTVIALENCEVNAVSREKLDALLKNLDCDVRSLFPSVTVKNF